LTEFRDPGNELLSSNAYNGFHEVVTSFNAVNDRTDFTYDAAHRVTGMAYPSGLVTTNFFYTSGANVGWLERTIDYDKDSGTPFRTNKINSYFKGLASSSTEARELMITATWDDLQRIITNSIPAGNYAYQYNKLDLEKTTDPLSNTNGFMFDALSRLSFAINKQSTNSFTYDCGLLCAATNALQKTTKFDHDNNANLLKITYPDTSVLLQNFNLLGQVTNRIDAASISVTNHYNNQGLLSVVSNAFG
jgi:YD repeat-containing protein